MGTDFAGEAEEDIEENFELEGPWTRWPSKILAKNFLPAYIKALYGTSMLAWKEKHHSA